MILTLDTEMKQYTLMLLETDVDVLNINAAYTFGKGLLAAEWQQFDVETWK